MATTPPVNDSVRAALEQGDKILARLDEITAEETSMNEQLDALELLLDVAVNSGNETEVRRLGQEGKEAIRSERAAQERLLEDAQDYFHEALKEYGESGEQTRQAALEIERLKKVLQTFDIFIANQDKYYDDTLANMHSSAGVDASQSEAKQEVNERAGTLEELLVALNDAKAAYEAKHDEIQAEKKNVAAQLAEERIARLKATL